MTDANFSHCLQLLLVSEGGNDDDPTDMGGRTSHGITQREYDAYRLTHPDLPSDVWTAPQSAIEAIYKISYWRPWCPQLPDGVDYVFFDVSVLHGPGKAAIWLQQALGVAADGHIGVITLTRLKSAAPSELISAMTSLRRAHFKGIVANKPSQQKFLKGWLARADRVEGDALQMARAGAPVTV
jgi:lysozyme family protein